MSDELEPKVMSKESAIGIEVQVIRGDRIRWLRETILPIVSLVAATVGLTMAFFTIYAFLLNGKRLTAISENQLKTAVQLKEVSDYTTVQLKKISDSQTTQYVGEFPGCLKTIVEVLGEAHPGEKNHYCYGFSWVRHLFESRRILAL